MRRLTLLMAGGAVWLFLAALPVFADGGPHITSLNTGAGGLTADSCAGCHRAHTAQGEYLLNQPSEEALCLSCHGTAGNGATTDVLTGVQYAPTGRSTTTSANVSSVATPTSTDGTITLATALTLVRGQTVEIDGLNGLNPTGIYVVKSVTSATVFTIEDGDIATKIGVTATVKVSSQADSVLLGALRDGGFLKARLDTAGGMRVSYIRGYEDGPYNTIYAISTRPKIGVGSSQATTSAHINVGNALTLTETIWGNGSSGVGKTGVELACAECHNPHGNGNYRILDPVPGTDADPLGEQVSIAVKTVYTQSDNIVTATQHGLVQNDVVTIAGVTGLTDGQYIVKTVTSGFAFQIQSTLVGATIDLTADSAVGTVTRGTAASPGIKVADSPVDPDGNESYPTKNYTILQTKGVQGVPGTFLLYARDVTAATASGGIAANQAAVNITAVYIDTGSTPNVAYLQTNTSASGVAVGDLVTIAGLSDDANANNLATGTYTVSAVSSSTTLYNRFALIGVGPSGFTAGSVTGTVVRQGISGNYTATGGDYFRRTVPWNPALINPDCSNTTYSTANSAYCGTMNDAPNGIPATITSGTGKPTNLVGQQAFLDQMSTWCSACHTRYYSNTNENIGNLPVIATLDSYITISGTQVKGYKLSTTGTAFSLPGVGDKVTLSNLSAGNGDYWVVSTGGSGSSAYVELSATKDGTKVSFTTQSNSDAQVAAESGPKLVRIYQSSASSWGYPRTNAAGTDIDASYKYQHSTASNRACTVCHVAHGSNARMTGSYSSAYTYADGTSSSSSRLLKVDNRGTCQMCHEPTGTVAQGTTVNPESRTVQVP